jgi:D-sedoheptulose 7-phosphate isomerase
MSNQDNILAHLKEASDVLASFISDPSNIQSIESAGQLLVSALSDGGKIYSCGNGGSMCDAMHFAEELTGKFREDRPSIAATAISDPGYLSCVGNDYGYEEVFARYLSGWGRKGDVLVAISTCGTGNNVDKPDAAPKKMVVT